MTRLRLRPHLVLAVLVALGAALLPAPADAGTVKVKLKLPVKAGIDLQGRSSVLVAPFVVVRQEGEGGIRGRNVDVQGEFRRYLDKILRRDTDLRVEDVEALDYPTYDMDMLSKDTDFWRAVGERNDVDLILTGSLDFDVQDKSGYQLEEYVSPFDGRTYYRQVLVEQTGFEYDILMQVYDGRTGALIHSDNFKDFKTFEGESADPLVGMFQNLYSLEDRIGGIFAQKQVEASRILFNP